MTVDNRVRPWIDRMGQLVAVVQELSLARNLETITSIVRTTARQLTAADGASFVLKDGDYCYYADEDAISPLWKGQRFPASICIGGWCMRQQQQVVIEDVYGDSRIPIEAYRPTFIKSLVMVPIRKEDPIGAIGIYWAEPHRASLEEIQLIQALADSTSIAMENVRLYAELEQRVHDRTAQLEMINKDLEAFSYTLSHDLRTPLSVVSVSVGLLKAKFGNQLDRQGTSYLEQVQSSVQRIDRMIEDILTLYRGLHCEVQAETVDLSQLAQAIVTGLTATQGKREVQITIQAGLIVSGDPDLLQMMLENLLSNAWKYTSKRSQTVIEFGRLTQSENLQTFFIRDNGVGFDMSQIDKLFVPFQRLHSQSEFSGTGVGLASVQRIIHNHGGKVWAESEINQGATFYFSLPNSTPDAD